MQSGKEDTPCDDARQRRERAVRGASLAQPIAQTGSKLCSFDPESVFALWVLRNPVVVVHGHKAEDVDLRQEKLYEAPEPWLDAAAIDSKQIAHYRSLEERGHRRVQKDI